MKKNTLVFFRDLLIILFGNFLYALMVYVFVEPFSIAMGGFTGIGLSLNHLFSIPAEYFVLPANLLVLVLGWFVLGKKMVMSSVASSVLYPVFLRILRLFPSLTQVTENPLLATLLGGAGLGAALGLLMRVGASTGGTDILCLSFHKWFRHISVSTFVFASDFIIVAGQVFVSGIESVLHGIVLTVMMSFTMNKVILLGQSQVQIMAISGSYEKIRDVLIREVNAGVTMVKTQSGLLKEDRMSVLCVVHPSQAYHVEQVILNIDPGAFITVTQIKEVQGRGFSMDRQYLSFAGETDKPEEK